MKKSVPTNEDIAQIALGLRHECVGCGYVGVAVQQQPKNMQAAGHTTIDNKRIYYVYRDYEDKKYRCITCQNRTIMGLLN